MELVLRGHAKINLILQVRGKRPDGYHDIETVFQSIGLHDLVRLRTCPVSRGISVHCEHPAVPHGEENLAYRAALAMAERYGARGGLEITIEKKIPVAAGLGGGSVDAACVLAGVNMLWDLGLAEMELMSIGATLGADVPFLVRGGTAIGRGKGELLEWLQTPSPVWLVLLGQRFGVSTAEVYRRLSSPSPPGPAGEALDQLARALRLGHLGSIASALRNDLEKVTFSMHPSLENLKKRALEAGALGALMCGSGPTLFALAESEEHARRIAGKLHGQAPWVWAGRTIFGAEKGIFPLP